MTLTLKHWLKRELDTLVSVQSTLVGTSPDLVINTWNGVKINVHLVHEPLKVRQMRRQLQDATSIGTGTLYIVSESLLPKDNTRVLPDEWLLAIHALTGDRIYGFKPAPQGFHLLQVHFEPVNGLNAWEVQLGPEFQVDRVRFYRATTKPRAIKGDWLVADFDTACFWKENDYRNHRERMVRERRRAAAGTTWQTWSGFQTWAHDPSNAAAPASPLKTYLDMCYETLGLKPGADRETVKAAFRKLAREVHPDTSQLPKEEAEARFKALSSAYEYIKSAQGWH